MLFLNYNEQQQHGTNDFPVAFYHVDSNHPRYEMPFHWHKEYEIVRVLEGTLCMTLSGTAYTIHAGDSLVIANGILHGGAPDNCVYECLVFDPDILFLQADSCRQYMKQLHREKISVHPLITAQFPEINQLVQRLFAYVSRGDYGYELSVTGCLLELFGIIFREKCYASNASGDFAVFKSVKQLKSVFEYIESNYASKITLQQLSQRSGMSPKYFCRYFQTIAHKTPMDYVNYYRIERACFLLCTTDLPITDIAYDCGFNDCSYFIKLFKKYKHTTPKQYQLQMKQ